MKKWLSAGLVLLLTLTYLASGYTRAEPGPPAPIRLQADTFVPALGEAPETPPGLTVSGFAPTQRGYYIVQFLGPVQENWKDQVVAQGAELLAYIPDFAFKVRMTPAQAARVTALSSVGYVGLYQPAFKLSPDLDLDGTNLFRVRVERGTDYGRATAAIGQSGARVLSRSEGILLVAADAAQVAEIAHVADVAWVENYVLPQKHNEYGAGQLMGASGANSNGYDGTGQIVAVADTGLGDGTLAGSHPDLASRVVALHNLPGVTGLCFQTIVDDGAIDADSGHGTHVAASVLGAGGAGGVGQGTAPGASLVFQATENYAYISNYCRVLGGWPAEGYFLTGLPDDLKTMYQQAYDDGARIHSNSWGSAQAGAYTVDSASTDDFVWDNPDMAITFSAGNDGVDANSNGVVDNDSTGSPATAKNAITVGASEGDRQGNYQCDTSLTYASHDAYQPGQSCNSMGGVNLLGTAGQRWGFSAEPLLSDVTAGNAQQMAPFSSRGPTDDGRVKPDIVAPGTWILSGSSGLYQEGYGDSTNPQSGEYQYDGWGMPSGETYKYMGGTSMSNPLVAGAAAVVRDFYQDTDSHSASAALTKATLINSAVDLLDENNDGANDNDFPIPNVHEGWGRVHLGNATDGSHQYVDNTSGLGTGGTASYLFSIDTAGQPFKVSLVWSDFASTEAAAQNLVNDLDLVVTAPGGTTYRGNTFSGGWSQAGGSADRVNNVENAYIQSAAAGVWSVEISGYNVPQGPQPFALVVDGSLGATPTPTNTPVPPTPTDTPDTGVVMHVAQVEVVVVRAGGPNNAGQATVTVVDANDQPVAGATVYGNFTGDSSGQASGATNTAGQVTFQSPAVKKGATWEFCVTDVTRGSDGYDAGSIVDTCDSTGGSEPAVTPTATPEPGGPPVHVADLDGSSAPANRNRWNASVTITVHGEDHAALAGATVDGSWSAGASGGATCVTDASGMCTVQKNNIKSNSSSATFTVSNITTSGTSYAPDANHDPDGDSDGTSIVVQKP